MGRERERENVEENGRRNDSNFALSIHFFRLRRMKEKDWKRRRGKRRRRKKKLDMNPQQNIVGWMNERRLDN